MKVSYLHIRNYKQFSDLELDLTYPKGHAKEGQPLDKICIIGQSGTGKTNLLDIIKKSTIDFSDQPKDSYLPFSEFAENGYIVTKFELKRKYYPETLFTDIKSKITLENKENKVSKHEILDHEKSYFVSTDRCGIKDTNHKTITSEFDTSKMSDSDKLLYDELIRKRVELTVSQIDGDNAPRRELIDEFRPVRRKTIIEKRIDIDRSIRELEEKYTSVSTELEQLKQNNFLDKHIVNINEENNSWKVLKESIDNYDNEKKQYEVKLFREVKKDPKEAEKIVQAMKEWEEKNENILEKMADDINSIIKKFNLELQIDEDTQSYEELKIKDMSNDTIIEYDDLSTGTKNLLSTFIPLKSYKPKDSIILIDEPEMSFYPNIQRELTDLYMSVGENNQLIMATHSPLIASSFEPWEVVELKFGKDNQIYREKYYEGENHVNNYTIDPRMLTWTGILTDVFDLREDSNFTFREKKLMEYVALKIEIKTMEDKTSEEAEKKIRQFRKLSELLGLQN